MTSVGPLQRRPQSLWYPPSRARLAAGIAVAVIGPLLVTPLVTSTTGSIFPGVLYVLVVLVAAILGRLVAGAIGIAVSVVVLERYVSTAPALAGADRAEELGALLVFVGVAVIVSQLVARLARAA